MIENHYELRTVDAILPYFSLEFGPDDTVEDVQQQIENEINDNPRRSDYTIVEHISRRDKEINIEEGTGRVNITAGG